MHHIAILKKEWHLDKKILSGEKKIESRWYKAKYPPWNKIKKGDSVYFKNAGEPVTVKANVEKVVQFDHYSNEQLLEIIQRYGGVGGINFVSPPEEVFQWAKTRKYCILIFLSDHQKIQPFFINKEGFGSACAWMCVGDVEKIRQ